MTDEIKELTIEHRKWGRDFLRRQLTDEMCVLGFFALKLGYTAEQITERAEIRTLVQKSGNRFPRWICDCEGRTTPDADKLIEANDCLYGEEREAELIAMFAKHNVQLRFA
jgi:hypothetical protein